MANPGQRPSVPPSRPSLSGVPVTTVDDTPVLRHAGRQFFDLLEHLGRISTIFAQAVRTMAKRPLEIEAALYQMESLGVRSVGIASVTAVFIGMVMAVQFAAGLQKFGGMEYTGRIIGLSSIAGIAGNMGQTNYAVSKAGVVGMVQACAPIFSEYGITINAVAPGFIESDMTAELDKEPILAAIPMGRMGSATEVAGAVRFLAADPAAAYMTGQVLQVDGGMVMR